MRYTVDEQRRHVFRDWLRSELRRLDFYHRRGNRYLVSEFARYAKSLNADVEEVSLGRYLRDLNPVLPTPESCRELARALGRHAVEVLVEAGYLIPEDFLFASPADVPVENLRYQIREIDRYTYLPDAIRDRMKSSLENQIRVIEHRQELREEAANKPSTPSQPGETVIPPPSGTTTPAPSITQEQPIMR